VLEDPVNQLTLTPWAQYSSTFSESKKADKAHPRGLINPKAPTEMEALAAGAKPAPMPEAAAVRVYVPGAPMTKLVKAACPLASLLTVVAPPANGPALKLTVTGTLLEATLTLLTAQSCTTTGLSGAPAMPSAGWQANTSPVAGGAAGQSNAPAAAARPKNAATVFRQRPGESRMEAFRVMAAILPRQSNLFYYSIGGCGAVRRLPESPC
jgi:hypothetical protein